MVGLLSCLMAHLQATLCGIKNIKLKQTIIMSKCHVYSLFSSQSKFICRQNDRLTLRKILALQGAPSQAQPLDHLGMRLRRRPGRLMELSAEGSRGAVAPVPAPATSTAFLPLVGDTSLFTLPASIVECQVGKIQGGYGFRSDCPDMIRYLSQTRFEDSLKKFSIQKCVFYSLNVHV